MPYKSDAQRRFFHSAGAKQAGISDNDIDEFDSASKGMKLPERVGKSKPKPKKRPVRFGSPPSSNYGVSK